MSSTINILTFRDLAIVLIPVVAVLLLLNRWSLGPRPAMYALGRMLAQLLLVGYVLSYIFGAQNSLPVMAVLILMLVASSWISLTNSPQRRAELYPKALLAIIVGGGSTLLIVTQGVLRLDPWFDPKFMIPLAGMIFGSGMNSVSLAAERYDAEIDRAESYEAARNIALKTSMIPIINSLLAVGIVSIPGMMTGQILSGVSPLIAVRYQIMVMSMIFGATGLSAGLFLALIRPDANPSQTKDEN